MTALEKIRSWLATFPDFDILSSFSVDYIDRAVPNNGGIFLTAWLRWNAEGISWGNSTVTNQYNFGIYGVFAKPPGDDVGAVINADWVSGFQEWVQAQSVTGDAPHLRGRPER